MQPIENKVINRIYGNGRGWAFSKKDFAALGQGDSLDKSLARLAEKGKIRRLARGLYDYPRYSKWLEQTLEPDFDQVAHALARKFAWKIQVTGNAALNIMGLSTQIPTQYLYLSDGPSKTYEIAGVSLTFKKTPLTTMSTKLKQSTLLVQAIEALGQTELSEELNKEQNQKILNYLAAGQEGVSSKLAKQILKDTQYVTGWVQQRIYNLLSDIAADE